MAAHVGYSDALRLAQAEMKTKDPQQLAENTGTVWNGQDFEIPWLGQVIPLSQGSLEQQIIWYHYLLAQGPKQPRGRHVAYKQVPGAAIYDANFKKRCIDPMVKIFGAAPEKFAAIGAEFGGVADTYGDVSFTLHPMPYVPLTCILWRGDDEMPASGNILFDEGAIEWLCAEDLVVLASLPIYAMIKAFYQS